MSVVNSFTIFKEDDEFVAKVARTQREWIKTYRLRGDRPGRLVEMLHRSPRLINHRVQVEDDFYDIGRDMDIRASERQWKLVTGDGAAFVYEPGDGLKHHFTLR